MRNFRCFEETTVDFHPRCTVLVGDNGAGKSAVLEAATGAMSTITSGFDGDRVGFRTSDARLTPMSFEGGAARPHMQDSYPVCVEAHALLADRSATWQRELRRVGARTTWASNEASEIARAMAADVRSARDVVLPVIAYYGTNRLIDRRNRGPLSATRFGAYQSCLESQSDTRRLVDLLLQLHLSIAQAENKGAPAPMAAKRQIEALDLACASMLAPSGWEDPRIQTAPFGGLTLRHPQQGVMPIGWLASGVRITALLALDIASRAARANPALGARELLDEVPGIVLIDEVDLHLHPTWQKQIVDLLIETFPRIQFLVTTHSPLVLGQRPADQVRQLEANPQGGVKVSMPRFARGLGPEVILRETMGTDPIPGDTDERNKLDRYLALVEKGQGDRPPARQLRAELEEALGGAANVREFAEADARILFDQLPG